MEVVRSFSDIELITNLQSGNRINESIRAIYKNHFDYLCWFVINNSGNREDAEDIFQEVVVNFIEAVQKNKFRGESSVKTFLYSLNRHAWLNELKRRGRASQRELKYERELDRQTIDVSHFIADREAKSQIMKIIDQLGDVCKKILVMFYYENLSMREILEKMKYETEQVVRNKKYKCLKQLEQMLDDNPLLKETLKKALHG
jgi:RNA polymerase sigma factor (sigma-70 family)